MAFVAVFAAWRAAWRYLRNTRALHNAATAASTPQFSLHVTPVSHFRGCYEHVSSATGQRKYAERVNGLANYFKPPQQVFDAPNVNLTIKQTTHTNCD
ncbi:unnamed protein product, partial [Iphiclides podalirius]